jgi:hypothetical protein
MASNTKELLTASAEPELPSESFIDTEEGRLLIVESYSPYTLNNISARILKEAEESLNRLCPGSCVEIITNSNHCMSLEQPQAYRLFYVVIAENEIRFAVLPTQ